MKAVDVEQINPLGNSLMTDFTRQGTDWSSADEWEKSIQDEKNEKLKKEQWKKIVMMLGSGGGIGGLVVTSKVEDGISQLKQYINKGLDGFYTANFDDHGRLSLLKTNQEGKMTKQQKAFYNILNTVINSSKTVFIEIVSGDPEVQFGQWDSGKIDIGDMSILGNSDLRLPQFFSAQGGIAHEFYEQYQKQSLGKTDGERTHTKTISAVDNKVNSSTRTELGAFKIKDRPETNSVALRNRITLSTGVTQLFNIILINGNSEKIEYIK